MSFYLCGLTREPIFFMATMHREKQISLKLCIFVEQQSHIEEVKTVR